MPTTPPAGATQTARFGTLPSRPPHLELDGWQESVGVRRETEIAQALGIPVRHIVPEANTQAPVGV